MGGKANRSAGPRQGEAGPAGDDVRSDLHVRVRLDAASELTEIVNTPAQKYERSGKRELLRPGLIAAVQAD